MDKFVTFIGYIQNYVVPSRRNGSQERTGDSSGSIKHGANAAQRTTARNPDTLNQSAVNKQAAFLRTPKGHNIQGKNGLPDIFSTDRKRLVQVKHPSIPYVPVGRKCPVVDTLSADGVIEDRSSPEKSHKSGLKLPKLRKKSKKKKKKDSEPPPGGQEKQSGKVSEQEPRNPQMRETFCATELGGRVNEDCDKLSEEKAIEAEVTENVICGTKQRRHRPRTALERWIKKRSNSVAPAPFEDDGSMESNRETLNDNASKMNEEKGKTLSENDKLVDISCRTILVTENKENVSALTLRENANNKKEYSASSEDGDKILDHEAKHGTATRTDALGYEKEQGATGGATATIVSSNKMEKVLSSDNATCEAHTRDRNCESPSVSTGQISTSEAHTRERHYESPSVSTGQISTLEARGCGGKYDRKNKQLITLEMRCGHFEPPTLLKKSYSSEFCKPVSVKKRIRTPLAGEIKHAEHGSSSTENENDVRWSDYKENAPGEAKSQCREQTVKINSKPKKKVRFNLEHGAVEGVSNIAADLPISFKGHNKPSKKPKTFIEQFQALTYNDCSPGTSSEPPPPLPDNKPKWHGAGPCLPSIQSERKPMGEDFLARHRKTEKDLELGDVLEGWGESEPEEVKRILEGPITAELPRYPTHWASLPNERPPGRGGQGYGLRIIWKKPERFLSSEGKQ